MGISTFTSKEFGPFFAGALWLIGNGLKKLGESLRFHEGEVYPLVMTNSSPWKDPAFLIGKLSINGQFSMAMLNKQRIN